MCCLGALTRLLRYRLCMFGVPTELSVYFCTLQCSGVEKELFERSTLNK